jgi:AcrR family transcriptional regulator
LVNGQNETMPSAAVREDVRERILDAVERLLARYGYRKMTMDDLAREAGIGKGTTYLYFPSKEEVALSSIDRVVERVLEQLRADAHADASPVERLRRMLVTRVLVRFDSVRDYSQSLDEMFEKLRPAYLARRRRYFDAEAELFAAVLAEGRRLQLLAVDDEIAAAYTLLLATNSLLPYSLSARELGARAQVETSARRLADLLLAGLCRRE